MDLILLKGIVLLFLSALLVGAGMEANNPKSEYDKKTIYNAILILIFSTVTIGVIA